MFQFHFDIFQCDSLAETSWINTLHTYSRIDGEGAYASTDYFLTVSFYRTEPVRDNVRFFVHSTLKELLDYDEEYSMLLLL